MGSPEPADSSDSADGSQSDEEDKNPKVEADVSMIASVAPLTIVAEMMHGMDSHKEMTVHTNEQRQSDKQSNDNLIIGFMMALLLGNYVFDTMKMQRKLKILPLICIFAAIAYCVAVNFLSTDPDYTALNVTIDLDLDENIEYDTITKG